MSDLKSLSEIFEHRLVRIPDYQRGYAWRRRELKDFWEDLLQLSEARIHYTGVITLEPVKPAESKYWQDDQWLIEGKGYKPYYVVDGQQRLTTSLILVQTILESIPADTELNFQSPSEIQSKYVLQKGSDGLLKSFLFGYVKDDPSEEFLRTKVFQQASDSNQDQQTLYTRNLAEAKKFFLEQVGGLGQADIASIFRKLTQRLKFNLYEIDDEIDVFVTFETMNNRGRQLSNLELLKNRLIYLSTLFSENDGHQTLRRKINNAWRTIYEYLGRNPENPLSDNVFLLNHWIMYFQYSRNKGDDYIRFLLDEKFTAKNVTHPSNEQSRVTIAEIDDYVASLQQAIKPWFYMHNPYAQVQGYDDEKNKELLSRLTRLGYRAFRPLILAAFCREELISGINRLMVAAERYNFSVFTLSQRRANTGDSEFYSLARRLLRGEVAVEQVGSLIDSWTERYYSPEKFVQHIQEKYELGRAGFYSWEGIRYFLYEHERHLQKRGKQAVRKLSWRDLTHSKKDHITVEHIYPQTETTSWAGVFDGYSNEEKRFLTHSLGNLLPLSHAKNASLQNDPFDKKKNNGSGVGYYNGSISENEVAQELDWTAKQIVDRGMVLLSFMEKRWEIGLGDDIFKRKLLCVEHLHKELPQAVS